MSRGTAKDVATVVAAAGEIVGKTRLQKTVALLEIMDLGFGFSYDYYLFGPFSEELVVSTERATALGYVTEEVRRANWGGVYSLYKAPQQESGNPARDEVISIAKDADSVVLELAATAAYLATQGDPDPWKEVERRKPEKATRVRIRLAKTLYRRFAAVAAPKGLPNIAVAVLLFVPVAEAVSKTLLF